MNHRNTLVSKPLALLILFSSVLVFAATASAVVPTPLDPGVTEYNPALNPAFPFFTPNYVAGPLPANYALVTTFNVPYNYNGTMNNAFFGHVATSVYRYNNPGNPADPLNGTLAFGYVFDNLTPPVPPNPPLTDIVRATINDTHDPWMHNLANNMDVPFKISAAGADPNSGGHSTPINGIFGSWNNGVPFDLTRSAVDSGVAVEFNPLNSGTQLNSTPNDQSAFIWLATDATHFAPTNVSFSDNGHVGTSQAYGPTNGRDVFFGGPEPSTLVLITLGGVGGVLVLRRRQRTIRH
jgi:hypothetical protein